MSECFYNRIPFSSSTSSSTSSSSNEELRNAWYRRILIEFTPNGNIVMYFDPDQFAFMYHSDNSHAYAVLRAVASKYCRIYSCMDLYIDEKTMMNRSPLIDVIRKRDNHESSQRTKPVAVVRHHSKDHETAFVKMKNYNSSSLLTSGGSIDASSISKHENMTIRFIYLGKILNMAILKTTAERTGAITATATATSKTEKSCAPDTIWPLAGLEEIGECNNASSTTFSDFKQWKATHQQRVADGEWKKIKGLP